MRCILVILDGVGDRANQSLDGQTPLQAAHTPNLDHLATIGMNGLYHPYLQGIPMPSETAHFLLFGYDIREFPGRGYIEAIGCGVHIEEDEVGVLCRLCSVRQQGEELILADRVPIATERDLFALSEAIVPHAAGDVKIRPAFSHKAEGFLLISGAVSPAITDSDPIYEGRPLISVEPIDAGSEARRTASELNAYLRSMYRRLDDHSINIERRGNGALPINALVTQRAGKKRDVLPFSEKWGLKGLSVSSAALYWGLCKEIGMQVVKVRDSEDVAADMRERLHVAYEAKEYDFVHVHSKVPDEAGHTKDPAHKRDVLESIDRGMDFAIQEIASDPDTLLVVTADHSTASVGTMIHTGETVPLLMVGKYPRRDKVANFNEIECAQGALGLVKGKELMYVILDFLDKAKMQGLMDTPIDQPYYPGHYKPLTLDGC